MHYHARGAFLLLAGLLVSSFAFAQSSDISFVNNTGATIYFLYASPTTADSWGEDLLGNTVLPDGATFRARLRRAAAFDIRAIDSNDNEYIVWDWRANQAPRVTIRREAFVGVSNNRGDAALAWVNIRNETRYTIVQVVAVPASSGDWAAGERLLADWEAIHDGEEYRVELDVESSESMVYDFMLIDEDGDQYIKWDVNLQIVGEVVATLDDLLRR